MGPFITFEGGEGAGKSSQVERLAKRLQDAGREVQLLHEPGGTPLGEVVYGWLRDPKSRVLQRLYSRWSTSQAGPGLEPLAELFLFEAARAQLVTQVIRPALEREAVVVCDRFADSTTAYQGYGRGLPLDQVMQANAIATGGLKPDLTILLDVPPEVGLGRTRGADHRMEQEGLAFHVKVREGYQTLVRQEPERFLVLDAQRPIDELEGAIWERVSLLLDTHPSAESR